MKKTFLIAFLFSMSSHAQSDLLSCRTGVGIQLCRALQRVAVSFETICEGTACYGVWNDNIQAANEVVRIMDNVPYGMVAEDNVGMLARTAAKRVCGQTATGDPDWIYRLFAAKRDLLPLLTELQQSTYGEPVVTCTLAVIPS